MNASIEGQMVDLNQQVIDMYLSLEEFLNSENFGEDLRKVLEKSHPGYINALKKRRTDIERSDQGIVIAGETSSGKTSLINKILEKNLFKHKVAESTSTVCKIRNSERIRIILEHESGEKEDQVLKESCDLDTKEGIKHLKKTLDKLTNMISSDRSTQYRSVDIGFPIPFLKGNAILVDTPGIGGSGQVTHKLMDYLPNALSFIFVINVASAGGMSNDRLPEILRSLVALIAEGEMPSFDPRNVIFITNKWDSLASEESDESEDTEEEDEEKSLWKKIQSEIKSQWPTVVESNIFKMSLKKVKPNKNNDSVKQFQEFKKVLMSQIEKAANARVKEHLRFLQELLRKVNTGLQARLMFKEESAELQKSRADEQLEEIENLKKTCKEMKETLEKRITDHIEKTAKDVNEEVNTTLGREKILNPSGKITIFQACDEPEQCTKEVQLRFNQYIELTLKSEKVMKEFKDIYNAAISFHEETNCKLFSMENQWAKGSNHDSIGPLNQTKELSVSLFWTSVLLSQAIWPPLLIVAAAVIGIVDVLPPAVLNWITGKEKKKQIAINKAYDECKSSVYSVVLDQINDNVGAVLNTLIKKATVDEPSKRMEALAELIQQLTENRQNILRKRDLLLKLASKIKSMEDKISKLQKSLTRTEFHAE